MCACNMIARNHLDLLILTHGMHMLHIYCTCMYIYLPHFQKDLSDFSTDLHQWMEVSPSWGNTQGIEVVRLETLCLPRTTEIIGIHNYH